MIFLLGMITGAAFGAWAFYLQRKDEYEMEQRIIERVCDRLTHHNIYCIEDGARAKVWEKGE